MAFSAQLDAVIFCIESLVAAVGLVPSAAGELMVCLTVWRNSMEGERGV